MNTEDNIYEIEDSLDSFISYLRTYGEYLRDGTLDDMRSDFEAFVAIAEDKIEQEVSEFRLNREEEE